MEFSTGRTACVAALVSTASNASRNSRHGIRSAASPKRATTASSLYAPGSPWYATWGRGRLGGIVTALTVESGRLLCELGGPARGRDDAVRNGLGHAATLHDPPSGRGGPAGRSDHLVERLRLEAVRQKEFGSPLHGLEGELERHVLRKARPDASLDHGLGQGGHEAGAAATEPGDRVQVLLPDLRDTPQGAHDLLEE